jgi:GNAT superfamily N-acetyltransferase
MEVTLRRGTYRDATAVADLYVRARRRAVPAIPPMVHTEEETRLWVVQRVVPDTELWVAESDAGGLVGLMVVDQNWVEQLYVEPTLTGGGIGTDLIGLAKREHPDGLRLWTFESNVGAQRFYERHGFRVAGRTAGENEEGAPDILYVWESGSTR